MGTERMSLTAGLVAAVIALMGWVALPADAYARTHSTSAGAPSTFSGKCAFSGPLTPDPSITVAPKSGSHFDYAGAGTCTGTLDGAAVTATPNTLTFTHVATVFDTCELGPDVNLTGQMVIGTGAQRAQFTITIDLLRLALVGPFAVDTSGGGAGIGTATFTPPSTTGALTDCAASGITTATLAGNFTTTSALTGLDAPAAPTSTTTTPTTSTTPTATRPPATTRTCRTVRRPVIRLAAERGRRIVRVLVYVDGHRVLRHTGTRLTSVTVPRLSAGRHTVRIITRNSGGQNRTAVRRFTICS